MRVAGEKVKEIHDVAGELRVAGEQAQIDVQTRGPDVIVAGADVNVAA